MTLEVPTGARPKSTTTIAIVAVHVLVAGLLAWWSWRKWPDPLIDFGRELYVPWQITKGKVLYRDLASLFGPVSPYINALWFKLFGVSLTTLVVCNIAIFAATIAGIYKLLAASTDQAAAAAATLGVLLLCGFLQYIDVGNYNFVTPYSHEATHGLAFSVAALVAFHHGVSRGSRAAFGAAGLSSGIVLLTKPELGLALAAAIVGGATAAGLMPARARGSVMPALAFAVGTAAVPIVFLLYFHGAAAMSWADAARAVSTGWRTALVQDVAQNEFYRRGAGVDNVAANGLRALKSVALVGAFMAAAMGLALVQPKQQVARSVHALLQLALLVAAFFAIPSGRLGWALPFVTATAALFLTIHMLRHAGDRDATVERMPLLMWSLFASVMLIKIVLNGRVYHYGFVLALPALTVLVVLVVAVLPRAFIGEGPRQRSRTFFAVSVVVAIVPALMLSGRWYRTKTIPVGSGGDRFYASADPGMWQGPALNDALAWLDRHAPKDGTLAALPEGVMANYLSRRDSPTRYVNFMPPETIVFGEHAMARSLAARPPDFLLLVHKDTSEYGFASFGSTPEYGGEILPWVRRNYRTVEIIGRSPADADGFGIEILQRTDVRRD